MMQSGEVRYTTFDNTLHGEKKNMPTLPHSFAQ